MMRSLSGLVVSAGVVSLSAGVATAAPYAVQTSLAEFEAAVGGLGNGQSQDFQGFNVGDDMSAPGAFLGSIDANTNLGSLEVFGASKRLSGLNGGTTVREDEIAYYEFDVTVSHMGIAFVIEAWDPASSGATIDVYLEGGFSESFVLANTSTDESTSEVFLGITSSSVIDRIVIHEPIEANGGNEEFAFSWVHTSRIPGAGVPVAMALAIGGVGARRRRTTR